MLRFALTRALSLALSLAVASLVIFAVIEVIPGDPASYMLGLNATPEDGGRAARPARARTARSSRATSPGSAAC